MKTVYKQILISEEVQEKLNYSYVIITKNELLTFSNGDAITYGDLATAKEDMYDTDDVVKKCSDLSEEEIQLVLRTWNKMGLI